MFACHGSVFVRVNWRTQCLPRTNKSVFSAILLPSITRGGKSGKMTFLAVYFIVNIAVAVILDRKRLSVALISHVVMFSVMSVFVLFCSGVEFISQAAMRLLGDDAYEILLSAMCFAEAELLLPIVIKLVLTLQFALVTAAFTCEVVHYLQARKPRKQAKRPEYAPQARVNTTLPVLRKLCYLNQSILC